MARIQIQNVTLHYPVYETTHRRLISRVGNRLRPGGKLSRNGGATFIEALRDVTLDVGAGSRVALVGHNGAGKSTLIRVIAGIYPPTTGRAVVEGHVTALLNLAVGIDRTATGLENIILSGLMHGLTRAQIEGKIDEIAEFSELEEYLEMPVRLYSQGMAMRLAFAVSSAIEPDILLMDEWIGVGDKYFFEKAKKRLDKLISNAKILVIATHRQDLITTLCNRAVLLERGQIIADDEPVKIIERL